MKKLTGSFDLVQKVSGFSRVDGSAIGLDVSGDLSVGNGILLSTVFSGSSTTYVKKYTSNSYAGYNFNNDWTVNCPGIPVEDDASSTINLYYSVAPVVNLNDNTAIKLPVTTTAVRNFRTRSIESNQLNYEGSKERAINVYGSISFTATGGMRVILSIYKNNIQVPGTEVSSDIATTNSRQAVAIIGTVIVKPTDKIEIYVQRSTAASPNQFLVTGYNLLVN